jgi:hypothetical protein
MNKVHELAVALEGMISMVCERPDLIRVEVSGKSRGTRIDVFVHYEDAKFVDRIYPHARSLILAIARITMSHDDDVFMATAVKSVDPSGAVIEGGKLGL